MIRHKSVNGSKVELKRKNERLQDEVYRQVFRLEAHRQGAEVDLSVALLRAWQAAEGAPTEEKEWTWLRNICPICIKMIEAAKRERCKDSASIQ